jgi:hypothetical protein
MPQGSSELRPADVWRGVPANEAVHEQRLRCLAVNADVGQS